MAKKHKSVKYETWCIDAYKICKECDGSGEVWDYEVIICTECNGTGKIKYSKKVDINKMKLILLRND